MVCLVAHLIESVQVLSGSESMIPVLKPSIRYIYFRCVCVYHSVYAHTLSTLQLELH